MYRGYGAVWRKIKDSPIWRTKKHELGKLAIHCLLTVNHKENRLMLKGGNIITIKPGQFFTCHEMLMRETFISRQSLRTCLALLKKVGFLTIESTNQGTLITLINYDTYRDEQVGANQQTNQQLTNDQPMTNQCLTMTNKDKNNNNEKKEKKRVDKIDVLSPELFREFWNTYPHSDKRGRSNKVATRRMWNARLRAGAEPQFIVMCAGHYRDSDPDKEFTQGAQAWIGQNKYFEDWAEASKDSKEEQAAEVARLVKEMRRD